MCLQPRLRPSGPISCGALCTAPCGPRRSCLGWSVSTPGSATSQAWGFHAPGFRCDIQAFSAVERRLLHLLPSALCPTNQECGKWTRSRETLPGGRPCWDKAESWGSLRPPGLPCVEVGCVKGEKWGGVKTLLLEVRSVEQHPFPGSLLEMWIPILDLLSQNTHLNKVPRWIGCTEIWEALVQTSGSIPGTIFPLQETSVHF